MGRLIDESELIEIIQGNEELLEFQKDECINCIKACDTAYDQDNVVKQLEEIRVKKTCNKEKCDEKELCRICVVDDAIEIVKAGGNADLLIDRAKSKSGERIPYDGKWK